MAAKIGLSFRETMSGTYRPLEGTVERPFQFQIAARAPSLARLLGDGEMQATGTVDAEGLAQGAALDGTMTIRPLVSRIVRYAFGFTGDDGQRYRYLGEKHIRHLHPVRTWTTLDGQLYDAHGNVVASSTTFFDLRRQLVPFLLTYRLVWSGSPRPLAAETGR